MLGGGIAWSRRPQGLASGTLAIGTRGPRTRMTLEAELSATRISATERHEVHRLTARGLELVRGDTVAVTATPLWLAVRFGLEFPLSRMPARR